MSDRRRGAPTRKGRLTAISPAEPPDYNRMTPKFCLAYVLKDFSLDHLGTEHRAAAAMAFQKRCSLTWNELCQSPRHGLGPELISVDRMRCSVPEVFADQKRLMVLRCHGKLPMAGVRIADTFHVLAFERAFGELYDHGG